VHVNGKASCICIEVPEACACVLRPPKMSYVHVEGCPRDPVCVSRVPEASPCALRARHPTYALRVPEASCVHIEGA
jgi:hypothetical protein